MLLYYLQKRKVVTGSFVYWRQLLTVLSVCLFVRLASATRSGYQRRSAGGLLFSAGSAISPPILSQLLIPARNSLKTALVR